MTEKDTTPPADRQYENDAGDSDSCSQVIPNSFLFFKTALVPRFLFTNHHPTNELDVFLPNSGLGVRALKGLQS